MFQLIRRRIEEQIARMYTSTSHYSPIHDVKSILISFRDGFLLGLHFKKLLVEWYVNEDRLSSYDVSILRSSPYITDL